MKHYPMIFTAGRWGAWAFCSCTWKGPLVGWGAGAASISWALHVHDVATSPNPSEAREGR